MRKARQEGVRVHGVRAPAATTSSRRAADKIYVDPAGGLRLVGMAGTTMYFRGAVRQLGVMPQFEKIAEYKSAPEQFTETAPTPTAAKMHDDLFDSLWRAVARRGRRAAGT